MFHVKTSSHLHVSFCFPNTSSAFPFDVLHCDLKIEHDEIAFLTPLRWGEAMLARCLSRNLKLRGWSHKCECVVNQELVCNFVQVGSHSGGSPLNLS